MLDKNREFEGLSPIEKLKLGGEPANQLVGEYAPRLLRFFSSLGADARTAEDLTQEVFIKLIRSEARYEERGEFKAYIYQVAYRIWIDEKRVRKPLPFSNSPSGDGPSHDIEHPESFLDLLHEQELESLLQSALNQLPEEQRVVFEMGVIQGMRYREVADVLKLPVGTVKSRIFHAVAKLKEILAQRNRLYEQM